MVTWCTLVLFSVMVWGSCNISVEVVWVPIHESLQQTYIQFYLIVFWNPSWHKFCVCCSQECTIVTVKFWIWEEFLTLPLPVGAPFGCPSFLSSFNTRLRTFISIASINLKPGKWGWGTWKAASRRKTGGRVKHPVSSWSCYSGNCALLMLICIGALK